jgi:hypothetical protein
MDRELHELRKAIDADRRRFEERIDKIDDLLSTSAEAKRRLADVIESSGVLLDVFERFDERLGRLNAAADRMTALPVKIVVATVVSVAIAVAALAGVFVTFWR